MQAAASRAPVGSAADLRGTVSWRTAIESIAHGALRSRGVSRRSIADVSQGQLLLMDGATLTLQATFDGIAWTSLRTRP